MKRRNFNCKQLQAVLLPRTIQLPEPEIPIPDWSANPKKEFRKQNSEKKRGL